MSEEEDEWKRRKRRRKRMGTSEELNSSFAHTRAREPKQTATRAMTKLKKTTRQRFLSLSLSLDVARCMCDTNRNQSSPCSLFSLSLALSSCLSLHETCDLTTSYEKVSKLTLWRDRCVGGADLPKRTSAHNPYARRNTNHEGSMKCIATSDGPPGRPVPGFGKEQRAQVGAGIWAQSGGMPTHIPVRCTHAHTNIHTLYIGYLSTHVVSVLLLLPFEPRARSQRGRPRNALRVLGRSSLISKLWPA